MNTRLLVPATNQNIDTSKVRCGEPVRYTGVPGAENEQTDFLLRGTHSPTKTLLGMSVGREIERPSLYVQRGRLDKM